MKQLNKFILSGGGTGGHIYPAVSIAQELKRRFPDAEFLFVGAQDRMEMEKVPQAGFNIEGLWISGLQRSLKLSNLMFPFKVINSVWRARKIIKKFKPQAVIGTGGFASGPTLYAAAQMGIPTLIQEQNSYAGITNKLLSKKAQKICVAYDSMESFFPQKKIIKTGNPVRQDLLDISTKESKAQAFFNLDNTKKTLLVLGGSLGARMINKIVEENLDYLLDKNIQIIWQTGKLYIDEYQKYSDRNAVQTHAFLNRMDLAYASADFIISRAGAGSISELCIVGKPVVFIPSPNVAEDHQTKNAEAVVKQEAALMMKESDREQFEYVISKILSNNDLQKTLSLNIKKLALPDATKNIVDEIEKLINLKP
jgi:UDP-N-acetylglucosamine--N-acetylmuramyl-(pentapeptide) pyrophosphoryl-undecaprenol N-acetylglucosamine transferase